MTQYMMKDMILHTRNEVQCALGRTRVRLKAYCSAPWGVLHVFLLLLMMTVGVNGAWGQETTDYSGVWYINNQRLPDDGYYFVPTINCFYGDDEDQPHLTTFKTGKDKNSIWRIEAVSDGVYRIIHNATGKYLMANNGIPELANNTQKAAHRKRVHLETVSSFDSDATKDKSLFVLTVIDADKNIIAIKSKNVGSTTTGEGTEHLYLNPRGNNASEFDSYRAADGRAITNINGTVGFWGNDNGSNKPSISGQPGSCWKLETATSTCANPVIQYTGESTIQISYPIESDEDWTIYYTIDGSDPSDNANTNRTPIISTTSISTEGVTKVRAIATKDNWEKSDEAFLIASDKPQLIQSKECDAFYVVPPIVDGETNATTSNIPNAAMGWKFVPAGLYCGIQYYNILDKDGKYLYCNVNGGADNALVMKETSEITTDEQKDRAKFRLLLQDEGNYFVISKWWAAEKPDKYYVNKKSGNNATNALNLADGTSNTGLWNVIAAPSSPKTQFDASFASSSSTAHFYQIQSATDNNTYHVLPPTTSGGKATANTTGANPAWFFYPVDDNDTWIPYYHIRNSKTGEYLYYESGSNSGFYTSTTVDSNNKDRYMFVVVKSAYTTTTNPVHYNIIPKALKDQANQANNSMNRNGTTLRTQNSRNTPASNWKLAEVSLSCNNPVFNENDGSISISCVPDIIRVYYTTDGSTPDPTDENQRYTNNTSFSASDKLCIKAISTVSNESNSASSAVITLLNKPDVTLAGGPYTYKAADWEPSVTLSVGTTQTTTGFSTTYENQKNAGTANVTITDNEASDAWYIWNVPVTEFTIDKAPLTIKANDKTIGYGDDPDNAGVTYTGFVGSPAETEDVLGGTLSYSYNTSGDDPQPYTPFDAQYGNQGSYVITPSGLTSTNYDITFSTGVLTVAKKSIGDGALAEGFTLSFDEDGNVILEFGTHTLNKDVDYTIGNEEVGTKYSTRTLSGAGNYDGSVDIRNAIVHFTTDANESEWSATFVAEKSGANDIGHALPEGMKAFIITDIEGEWAIPEQLNYIPEGVPVLLVTNKETNGFIVKDASDKTPPTSTNWLVEVKTDWVDIPSRSVYLLYNNEFVLNNGGTGYTLSAGKVYLSKTAPGGGGGGGGAPSRLRIKWGEDTGIQDIQNNGTMDRKNDIWYTIDGRKLNGKPRAKGLYINGVKKIMVK